jgi:hypothetical protein
MSVFQMKLYIFYKIEEKKDLSERTFNSSIPFQEVCKSFNIYFKTLTYSDSESDNRTVLIHSYISIRILIIINDNNTSASILNKISLFSWTEKTTSIKNGER